jgi:hypothetical protein
VSSPHHVIPSPRGASDDTLTPFDPVAYDRATRAAAHDWEDQPYSPLLAQIVILGVCILLAALVGLAVWLGPDSPTTLW